MKRMKKVVLLQIRTMAYHWRHMRLYYWAEWKLFGLRAVCIMPKWYYRMLYCACLRLVEFRVFQQIANRIVHTIPLQVRFELA